MTTPKQTFIYCKHRAEMSENQTESLDLKLPEFQCSLNSQSGRISYVDDIDLEEVKTKKLRWGPMDRS